MRASTLVSASLLAAALVAGGVFLAPSFADDHYSDPVGQRPWLSIPQLHDKLVGAGYRDIEKIEREHGRYEVRATDRAGRRVKLHLNPWTGEIDARDRGEIKRGYTESDAVVEGRRGGAECSKRRCRDDLPQAGSAAPKAK